jgi:hypothetical protein
MEKGDRFSGGITDIDAFHQGTSFYFSRLGKNQACNDRKNYPVTILFFCLI